MRLLTLSKLLVLGAATAYVYKRHRSSQQQQAVEEDTEVAFADLVPDPGDPVQGFDEAADLHVLDLDLDALDADDAEASIDQAIFESDLDEASIDLDTPSETTLDSIDFSLRDTGDLYGVHAVRAVDRDISSDSGDGQNWLESLEASAAEYGAEPEVEVDPTDDADLPPHPSDTRDTPVADRGSGGPSGV